MKTKPSIKLKYLLIGAVLGGGIANMGSTLANSPTTVIADWVKFKFDGVQTPLPEDYTVLIHKDRTYVPARFVAEKLGADVEWDEKNHTVAITSPEKDVQDPSKPDESVKYNPVPDAQTLDGVRVEVYSVSKGEPTTKFYLKIKNTTELPIQLLQAKTYFTSEGNTYTHAKIGDDYKIDSIDNSWYADIREDDTQEGFVAVPSTPKNVNRGTLYLTLLQNDQTQKEISFKFDIQF